MLTTLVGYLSIFWGILWVVWPEMLRRKLLSKAGWYLFWLAMGVGVYPLVHFFGKRAGMAGIVAVGVVFWFAIKFMHTTLREVFKRVPAAAFRAAGLASVLSGCMLVWFRPK